METRMNVAGGSDAKKVAGAEHTRKKRHELSHSATKSLKKHDVKIMVSFS
jgi:hypothetical protein